MAFIDIITNYVIKITLFINTMKKTVASILCILSQLVLAQSVQTEKLNSYFDALVQNDKLMGTVRVDRDEENIYSKSVGYSNIETKTKATQNSTYKIGSISKTFTAVMIFQAIEKGKITLSTTIESYFPDIENAKEITIDHLLSHRSGIHNFTDNWASWATDPKTPKELLAIIQAGGSDFKPGVKAQYSNSNYVLLSYILETIHKKNFAQILEKSITVPLKLTHTYFGKPKENATCHSYKFFDKWRIESSTHPSVAMGAGGIISTTKDLNLFFHSLFNGKLIAKHSLEEMKTIQDGFGKGLFPIPFGKKMGYGHTGGIDGFSAVSAYFPDDKTAYSLTANATNYVTNNISIAVLSGVYNVPFDIPSFKIIKLSSTDLDKYLGIYSSPQLPIQITVSKQGSTLVAQGTGQSAFNLEASAEHTFKFEQAGIVMIFNPTENTMILKQGGATFLMKKNAN